MTVHSYKTEELGKLKCRQEEEAKDEEEEKAAKRKKSRLERERK